MATAYGRKKDSINATVSPFLKKRVQELVESGEFSSMSDVVAHALNKFLEEKDSSQQIRSHDAGFKIRESEQFEREIWRQKGIIYQKMDKLEEAISCYNKALGIESEESSKEA